jgi:hypothetical protein
VGVAADSSDEDGRREKRAMACFFLLGVVASAA